MQAAQESHWLLHCSIVPRGGGTYLGSPPQIAKHTPHTQEGPLQPPTTGWHCCLCPSSNVQCVHCTWGFVARMGWAAEPEICANAAPPWNPPMGKISTRGKRVYAGKKDVSAPPRQPIWPKGHQDSSRLTVLKLSTCSSVLIETLCHTPCELQHSFLKASCLERCLALSA